VADLLIGVKSGRKIGMKSNIAVKDAGTKKRKPLK
jgi:hypothetical protein